jgi:spore maturation protein CgeB
MRILCLFGRYAYGNSQRGDGYEYVNFLPALRALSPEVRLFDTFDRAGYRDFADLNAQLVQTVIDYEPDLIFAVFMHYEVWTETLDLIRSHTPTAILHWGTDDSWKFDQFSRFIAPHVDVHASTHAATAAKAAKEGLSNVVQTQWAASTEKLLEPLASEACDIDVSFVGSAYGDRRHWVEGLKARGIAVQCFGHGWDGGAICAGDLQQLYRRSRVSLNFADSGVQLSGASLHRSRQIKARTFEVPGAGGLLLTQSADGLGAYFQTDKEICVYETIDELEAAVRALLEAPARRDSIARAGHARVRREHTYGDRLPPLVAQAMETASKRRQNRRDLCISMLQPYLDQHAAGPILRGLSEAARAGARMVLGRARGGRAVRRAAYEIGWRLGGKRVYRASGWPGRLFFAES